MARLANPVRPDKNPTPAKALRLAGAVRPVRTRRQALLSARVALRDSGPARAPLPARPARRTVRNARQRPPARPARAVIRHATASASPTENFASSTFRTARRVHRKANARPVKTVTNWRMAESSASKPAKFRTARPASPDIPIFVRSAQTVMNWLKAASNAP